MKSPRAQLFFALGLLAAALVAYYFWYSVVAGASANAAALASSIAAANEAGQEARAARSAQSGLGESEGEVDQYFLAESDVVPFLEALQAAGTSTGALVNVSSVGATQGKQNTLAVSLHITGTFDAVMRAAGAIEEAPYDLSENSLTLQSDGKGQWHADQALTVGAKSTTPSK